jgi:hypothetical protein
VFICTIRTFNAFFVVDFRVLAHELLKTVLFRVLRNERRFNKIFSFLLMLLKIDNTQFLTFFRLVCNLFLTLLLSNDSCLIKTQPNSSFNNEIRFLYSNKWYFSLNILYKMLFTRELCVRIKMFIMSYYVKKCSHCKL